MKNTFAIILAFMILMLCACAAPEASDSSSMPEASESADVSDKRGKYICISCMSSYEYFTDHRIGFIKACQELGVDYEYLAPMENDINSMKGYFEYAIEKKVDGIVAFGASDELTGMIDKAWRAGIPTVTIDGDVKNSKRIAFVGTGNETAGEKGAKIAISQLGVSGNVAILTEPEMQLHMERTAGAMKVFDSYHGINVVASVDTGASTDTAYTAAIELLKKHPETELILCTDYFGGAAAAAAVEELDLVGKIKIIAMDRSSYVLKKIEEGVITATLMQQTALMPYYAMMILNDYNNPTVSIVPDKDSAGVTGTPSYIDTGVFVIDKSNYEYFTRN